MSRNRPLLVLAAAASAVAASAWLITRTTTEPADGELIGSASAPDAEGELAESFVVLDDGSRLELDVAQPMETAPGDYTVSATLELDAAIPDSEAVVFAFDTSYSTYLFGGNGTGCGGDFNNSNGPDDIIDCELAAILATIEAVEGFGSVAEVGLVPWFGTGDQADVSPLPGFQGLTSPSADLNGDGERDLETVLRSVVIGTYPRGDSCANQFDQVCVANGTFGGQTDYSVGLAASCDLLATSAQPVKTIVFLSDGESTRQTFPLNTVLPCAGAVVHTVAVGAGSSCDEDPRGRGSLQEVADLGGGTCIEANDPVDLSGILLQALVPQITQVTLSIDGGPDIDVSASVLQGLPHVGSGLVHLEHFVAGLAEGEHEFCVTAHAEGTFSGASGSVTECVDTSLPNTEPLADAGPDQVVVEGTTVSLDGSASSDPDGDPLTYKWTQIGGPPVIVPGSVSATATFQALDDGEYVFELTVADGELQSTDTVAITVDNADPVLSVEAGDATAEGVSLVTAAFTDEGVLDTHTATVDWGDGSPLEVVPVSAQGTGWGSLYASHVYADPGSYPISVTVTDDDGGVAVAEASVAIGDAVALWGDAEAGRSVDLTGGGALVDGLVHSNAELKISGAGKTVTGTVEYVSTAKITGGVDVDPAPVQVAPAMRPVVYDLADYRPGGAAAVRAGIEFHDVTGDCADGVWEPSGPVAQGLYYAACDVHLTTPALQGTFTLAAEGTIHVAGSGVVYAPYVDGLLFLSGDPSDKSIQVSSSGDSFLGFLYSAVGGIKLTGTDSRFLCGIVGETVDLSGTDLEVTAADCTRPGRTTAPPVLVPELTLTLDNGATDALPGESVPSDIVVSNDGALLLVPGIVGLEHLGTAQVTVTSADVVLEAYDLTSSLWTTVPGTTTLTARSNPDPGVTYPAPPDLFVGTVLQPDALASWGAELQVDLDPATLLWLLDPAQVDAVRMRVDFVLDDPSQPVRQLFRFGDDIVDALRTQGGAVADVSVTAATIDGSTHLLDGDTDSPLLLVGPGESVPLSIQASAPVPAPKSATESNEAYLGRLATLDGAHLGAVASARGTGGVGTVLAPQVLDTTTLHVPVVDTDVTAPVALTAAEPLVVEVEVGNASTADAMALSTEVTFEGATELPALPADLLSGQVASDRVDFVVDPALTGTSVDQRTTVSWSDAAGNDYGPLAYDTETFVDAPAAVVFQLADGLAVDADNNGLTGAGDTLSYSASVCNEGSQDLEDTLVSIPLDSGLSLVTGSVSTTAGTVVQADDAAVVIDVGTLAGFSNVTVGFEALTDAALQDNVDQISVQGTVTATGSAPVVSDDPATATLGDPTVTELLTDEPELQAALDDLLLVDADLNAAVTASDTLHYSVFIANAGGAAANGLLLDLVPDPGSTLVNGSVSSSRGTITLGNGAGDGSVLVDIGHFPALSTTVIELEVLVGASSGSLSVQGLLTATDAVDVLTDDPMTVAVGDPTITQLGVTGEAGGGPGDGGDDGGQVLGPAPTVTVVTPTPGDRVGAPVDITADAVPLDGETFTEWRVVLYPSDSSPTLGTELGSGLGDPNGVVLGLLDPTVLENGGWKVRVEATDTSGATGFGEAPVVVDGEAKLGSYDLAFLDAEWSTPISTTSLIRSYRSIRKDVSGDFGNGWRLSMTDVTVQTNGPLGDGGWTQEVCGAGLIFVPVCFEAGKPHLVVVKWPDGRIDAFDFTPAETSTFFPQVSAPGYTARPGTFSTLGPVAGDGTLTSLNDGNLYSDLSFAQIYDPQQFWLTDPDGTRFLLDKADGLLEIVDPIGNRTLFTHTGIYPDVGAPVVFVRDGQDRIEQIELPDGSLIDYVYDAAGDLAEVVDGEGGTTEFVYDAAHRLIEYRIAGRPPIATVAYDADGRVDSVTGDGGVFTDQTSDVTGFEQVTVGPDPRLTTRLRYDANGMLVEQVQSYVDGAGVQQDLVDTWTYNAEFLADSHILATGATETWSFDNNGRTLTHVDPAGVLREWDYGPLGQIAEMREGGEVVESTTFGADDLPFEVHRGDGTLLRRATYDTVGLPLTIENGTGQTLALIYDGNAQIDTVVLPDFDGSPDVIDAVMDGRGQLLEVTRNYPDGLGTTEYTYDANGNRTAIIDPRGQVMSFTFDELGRQLSYTDKLGLTKTWTYDESGRELSMTNRNGETLARTYDAAGLLETVVGPGVDKEFAYDPLGRPVYSRNGGHVEERVYDGPFLVLVSVYGLDAAGHAAHTWSIIEDGAGRVVQLDGDHQSVTHGYDTRGRLASVTESSLGTYHYGYDTAGRVTTLSRPSGAVTTTAYNLSGQTTGIVTTDAFGTVVHELLTTYDARGLPDTQTDHEGVHAYEHDVAGRLVGVDHPAGAAFADESYTYDQADRRTSSHVAPLSEVVYDDADRPIQDAQYTYAYDDEGRRISRTDRVSFEVTTYAYSALDQLTELAEDGVTWELRYDARDLRVLVANDNGHGEAFVYDLNGLARESYETATGQPTSTYLTGIEFGAVLVHVDETNVALDALHGRLGTVVGWLDATGQPASLVQRDGYGNAAAPAVVVLPYGYTGHAEDPTGLVWGRARYLDPTVGAWITEDVDVSQPRMTYALGAPSFLVDPTGNAAAMDEGLLDKWACYASALEAKNLAALHLTYMQYLRSELDPTSSFGAALKALEYDREIEKLQKIYDKYKALAAQCKPGKK